MNSDLDLKAFCGERGGIVCTSSNAGKVFDWCYERGEKIFFFPDEHLGRNTANKYGIPRDEIVLWDPKLPYGGLEPEQIRKRQGDSLEGLLPRAHALQHGNDRQGPRRAPEGIKVIVHPECTEETVAAADYSGSTGFIQDYVVNKMKPGRQGRHRH
jgi:quinolinate synthase